MQEGVKKRLIILLLVLLLAVAAFVLSPVLTKRLENKGSGMASESGEETSTSISESSTEDAIKASEALWSDPETLHRYQTQLFDLINQKRQNRDLKTLKENKDLEAVAEKRLSEILEKPSHERPDGSSYDTIFDELHYSFVLAGENFAVADPDFGPDAILNTWLEDDNNKANIYRESYAGLAVKTAYKDGKYYTLAMFVQDLPTKDPLGRYDAPQIVELLYRALNDVRAKEGLEPVIRDEKVEEAAGIRAVEVSNRYGHYRQDGDWWETVMYELGIGDSYAEEGVQLIEDLDLSAQDIITVWAKEEEPELDVLFEGFKKAGVALSETEDGIYLVIIMQK